MNLLALCLGGRGWFSGFRKRGRRNRVASDFFLVFFPFSSVFSSFSFRFLPFSPRFFLVFFPFSFCFLSVFFRFLPFFPFLSVFSVPFSEKKKREDTVCETPFAKPRVLVRKGPNGSSKGLPVSQAHASKFTIKIEVSEPKRVHTEQ